MIPVKKEHEEQALDRLLFQFHEKDNITALIKGWIKGVQSTEDDLFELMDNRALSNAVGTQLDNIGKIVGAKRGGRSDAAYRDSIKLQILINTSNGTPSEILEILSLLTEASVVKSFPHYPLGGNLYTDGSTVPAGLAKTIQQAAPITHGAVHIYQDLNKDALTPPELQNIKGILVDNNGDEIVDNEGNNIVVGGLGAVLSENTWRGVLSELDDSIEEYGIPVELIT